MMSEVLIRKLQPNAVPSQIPPTQPQTSTSICEKETLCADAWTQANIISAVKTRNVCKKDINTQMEETEKEESETTQAPSSNTPRKRNVHNELRASEEKKKRLDCELD